MSEFSKFAVNTAAPVVKNIIFISTDFNLQILSSIFNLVTVNRWIPAVHIETDGVKSDSHKEKKLIYKFNWLYSVYKIKHSHAQQNSVSHKNTVKEQSPKNLNELYHKPGLMFVMFLKNKHSRK